ncbi:LytTR family DNA-binding domain-containing protein [Clostridium sp.]|uniref:LytTR family DNA-binding domain-containing protein n=1 Tax=Clostridium sp. TaxID=1506 RepID=UPI002FC5D227
MKVTLEENMNIKEIEVLIRYNKKTHEINDLIDRIKNLDKKIVGYGEKKEDIHVVDIGDVFYVESIDDSTFIYTETLVLKTKQRLYELEKIFGDSYFFRCNKSTILNICKIRELKPHINRTIIATMDNGEKVYISRVYVKKLKEILRG